MTPGEAIILGWALLAALVLLLVRASLRHRANTSCLDDSGRE